MDQVYIIYNKYLSSLIVWLYIGPAAYNLPTPMSMGKTIGQKLHIDHELHYPSPNTYTIPETVGTGVAKGFGAKNNVDTGTVGNITCIANRSHNYYYYYY